MLINQYEPMIDYNDLNTMISIYCKSAGYLTEFKYTAELEQCIADFFQVKHCIVVNNGTISLSLALLAQGIKPGDRVLIPDITMIATAYAIQFIGAVPVLCDIEPDTLCMDLVKAETIIIERNNSNHPIKAVIYVSLNGRRTQSLQYEMFKAALDIHKIAFIEDNAQSFGSKQLGQYITCPEKGIGSFSFSMPKIITTGQGGCLVTNDTELAQKLRKLKDFGRITGGIDIHDDFGINCKFTEFQAITGLSQMKTIQTRISRKQILYDEYHARLYNTTNITFLNTDFEVTPWFVDIYVENRDALVAYLATKEIKTRPIYPALHTQKLFNNDATKFPQADKMAKMGLWLPSTMTLPDTDVAHICQQIKLFYKEVRS